MRSRSLAQVYDQLRQKEPQQVKLGTFIIESREEVCLVDAERQQLWPLRMLVGREYDGMQKVIRKYAEIRDELSPKGPGVPMSAARIAPPLVPRRNILCVGKNYHEHAREFSRSGFDAGHKGIADAVPKAPIVFTKPPESVIASGQPVRYPVGVSDKLDYEAELAVIIGERGRGISREDAYDHVWGYTIINDVTARDLQLEHTQWFIGKSLDTFCPMGPWIVTSDDLDPKNLSVRCWVNNELRQDANTRDLIFDIPTLIQTLSAGMTLYEGDVISTGTPVGVGIGFNPPKFLRPGDHMKIQIDGIGVLENTVE